MGYTALYRKFRPATFDEMVGQEHITQTLKNQIISGRVGHAYLFNGGRGTGKTSAAKILARAINCLNPQNGEPCNECEICKEALNSSLTDIVEMDAASNNSVEDIRGIKEEVNFLPTKAKYRVYIIDEVHMLSTGAFNALLKTLEEPPEHVKFILATTEPQKLPATILSRCQRFDFKRISTEDIVKRLKIVCKQSNIETDSASLNLIADLSEGAMRDALSILERCIQNGESKISQDKIRELIGIPKLTFVYKLTESIVNYDIDTALQTIQNITSEGKDINNLLWEVIKYIKDILIIKTNGKLNLYNEEELQQIKDLAEKLSKERAIKLIYDLSELEGNIKLSTQKLIMFEAGIIKLCNKEEQTANGLTNTKFIDSNLEERIAKIENYLKKTANIPKADIASNLKPQENKAKKPNKPQGQNTQTEIKVQKAKVQNETLNNQNKNQDFWPKIVNDLKDKGKMNLYTNLMGTVAKEVNDLTIAIEFPNGMTAFGKAFLENPENTKIISDMVSIAKGKEMQIKYVEGQKDTPKQSNNAEEIKKFANGFDLPFNVID